jgi:hypothetical protein
VGTDTRTRHGVSTAVERRNLLNSPHCTSSSTANASAAVTFAAKSVVLTGISDLSRKPDPLANTWWFRLTVYRLGRLNYAHGLAKRKLS